MKSTHHEIVFAWTFSWMCQIFPRTDVATLKMPLKVDEFEHNYRHTCPGNPYAGRKPMEQETKNMTFDVQSKKKINSISTLLFHKCAFDSVPKSNVDGHFEGEFRFAELLERSCAALVLTSFCERRKLFGGRKEQMK